MWVPGKFLKSELLIVLSAKLGGNFTRVPTAVCHQPNLAEEPKSNSHSCLCSQGRMTVIWSAFSLFCGLNCPQEMPASFCGLQEQARLLIYMSCLSTCIRRRNLGHHFHNFWCITTLIWSWALKFQRKNMTLWAIVVDRRDCFVLLVVLWRNISVIF